MSRPTIAPVLLAVIAALSLSCADDGAPETVLVSGEGGEDSPYNEAAPGLLTASLGIQGGYVSADDKNVVALISFSNHGIGSCSGSLIAPNLVLTAQHCVSGLNTGSYVQCGVSTFTGTTPANQIYVTTETNLPNLDYLYKGVDQIIIPPGTGACGRDIALMILHDEVDPLEAAPLVPRVDTTHKSGDLYSAVGYGEIGDNAGGSGTRRRRDGLSTYCVSQNCPHWMQATEEEWVGEEGTCSGDSGGPAIDAENRVIGVVSRGGEGCTYPTYSFVMAWGDWIKDNAVYAAQLGGYEPPPWATGWPTHPDYSHTVGEACDGPTWCESGLCDDGYCTRRCNDDAPCPTSFICEGGLGQCVLAPVGGTCATDDGCLSGVCASGYCTRGCTDSLPCPTDHVCDANAQVCLPATLGDACVVDLDCIVGFCHEGHCTRPCSTDNPCPVLYGCHPIWGFCALPSVGQQCTEASECSTHLCLEESCTRQCNSEAPCPAGYSCGDDWLCTLIPAGSSCVVDMDCDGGFCEDGICTRPCGVQAPCPGGMICEGETSLCVDAPRESSGCSGSGADPSWWMALLGATVALGRRRRRLSST